MKRLWDNVISPGSSEEGDVGDADDDTSLAMWPLQRGYLVKSFFFTPKN